MATEKDVHELQQMEIGAADKDQLTEREKELLRLERELNAKLDQHSLTTLTRFAKPCYPVVWCVWWSSICREIELRSSLRC
ncbi:hypothetical protein K7432_009753 [Basidiobolus ranarum]|uniref:Uncharacterized protein n=1 Tax=Basidiobolus ranarum TaxID=34480 RepID=A0ABR2VWK7_9FUNG